MTDTERLDWLISDDSEDYRIFGSLQHAWGFWDVSNGLSIFVEGYPTARAAIDAAIEKQKGLK